METGPAVGSGVNWRMSGIHKYGYCLNGSLLYVVWLSTLYFKYDFCLICNYNRQRKNKVLVYHLPTNHELLTVWRAPLRSFTVMA